MVQIGNVPAIKAVKTKLQELQQKGLVSQWELPYEKLLTRLTAAIFFLDTNCEDNIQTIWSELEEYGGLRYSVNEEKKLSQLHWRVEFKDDQRS